VTDRNCTVREQRADSKRHSAVVMAGKTYRSAPKSELDPATVEARMAYIEAVRAYQIARGDIYEV